MIFVRDLKKVLFDTTLIDVFKCEVYVGDKDPESSMPIYHLYIWSRSHGNYLLETDNYSLVDKTHSIVSKEKSSGNDKKAKKQKTKK